MRFVFVSAMSGYPWGGSEELWSQAALRLRDQGHDVAASVPWWPRLSPPVWYEAEPLALYRSHDASNTGRYTKTGENLRDVKRAFEIIEGYVPNGCGKRLCREGKKIYARVGLDAARRLLVRRDIAGAAGQVRASLALCLNLRLLVQLAFLLAWAGWRACVHGMKASLRQTRVL
jgi:hypothetical protein